MHNLDGSQVSICQFVCEILGSMLNPLFHTYGMYSCSWELLVISIYKSTVPYGKYA